MAPIVAEFVAKYEGAVSVVAAANLASDLRHANFSADGGFTGGSYEHPTEITSETDMSNPNTRPVPPGEGPFTEGEPSLSGPAARGEKSMFDAKGGEWRPHKPDRYHEPHWDCKPAGKNREWVDIDLAGNIIPK